MNAKELIQDYGKRMADAIRDKENTSEPIAFADFPDRIRNLTGGMIDPDTLGSAYFAPDEENYTPIVSKPTPGLKVQEINFETGLYYGSFYNILGFTKRGVLGQIRVSRYDWHLYKLSQNNELKMLPTYVPSSLQPTQSELYDDGDVLITVGGIQDNITYRRGYSTYQYDEVGDRYNVVKNTYLDGYYYMWSNNTRKLFIGEKSDKVCRVINENGREIMQLPPDLKTEDGGLYKFEGKYIISARYKMPKVANKTLDLNFYDIDTKSYILKNINITIPNPNAGASTFDGIREAPYFYIDKDLTIYCVIIFEPNSRPSARNWKNVLLKIDKEGNVTQMVFPGDVMYIFHVDDENIYVGMGLGGNATVRMPFTTFSKNDLSIKSTIHPEGLPLTLNDVDYIEASYWMNYMKGTISSNILKIWLKSDEKKYYLFTIEPTDKKYYLKEGE